MAGMDFELAEDVTQVARPDGEPIRVRFRGDAARHPDVAAGLVRLLVEAADENYYEAVTSYAGAFGLYASYYLGAESVIIEINEAPTLRPLVNAPGGSPRAHASRLPSHAVTRPRGRLRRLRAPSG